MTADELARAAALPSGISSAARALWLARNGSWDSAHDLCQEIAGAEGAWIHAWLHRQEGDYANACYWYARAGKPAAAEDAPLDQEWQEIAREVCGG